MPGAAEEVVDFNRDRIPKLVRFKFRRMAEGPFAFFRGTDHLFATRWARLAPPDQGPSVLICGDLHLENFGAYRAADGDFLYDINDFDEALVAPCSLDLVRCAASVLLAAHSWDYSPVEAMRTLLAYMDRYRATVASSARTGHAGEMALGTARGPIWDLLKAPARGDQATFLGRLTRRDGKHGRRIRREPGRFLGVGRERREEVRAAVQRYSSGAFEVRDVAFRVAGIGSLGLERYAVLVEVPGSPGSERLLDIKEARPPALLACAVGEPQPEAGSDADRVVLAQRQLQSRPTASLDVIAIRGRSYRLRDLVPDENRAGLDRLRKRPRQLRRAVGVAGRLTAWAHVRGSRVAGVDRSDALARWAAGPGLDAVIASAIRYADRTRRDYKAFRVAREEGLARGVGD